MYENDFFNNQKWWWCYTMQSLQTQVTVTSALMTWCTQNCFMHETIKLYKTSSYVCMYEIEKNLVLITFGYHP